MLPFSRFGKYWKPVLDLPRQDQYRSADLRCEQFLLFSECGLDAYYVPFHYLNSKARIVVIGVTPCWSQMERAFSAAKKGLANGLDKEALFHYVDRTGRFNGPMRWNLIEMLDGIGLQHRLEIDSCTALFRNASELAHFTSVISAPVFKVDQNYSGICPKLLTVPKLRDFVLENLACELASLPDAVLIPLGDVPGDAVQFLYDNKLLMTLDRCLLGFPHPSGANGYRKIRYDQGRKRWAEQLTALFQSRKREGPRNLSVRGRFRPASILL